MNSERNPAPYLSILGELNGHEQVLSDMAWSPDGRVLASASRDCTIRLWDVSARRELMVLRGHTAEITSLSFSPEGSRLASCSKDATIRCWHVSDGEEYHCFHGPTGFKSVAWSLDSMHLCAIQTKVIHIFSLKTGVIEDVLFLHERWAYRALWLQDGTIVSGGDDENLIMWNVVTGRPFARHRIDHGGIKEIAYGTRSEQLATGSTDGCIQLWNLEPWQEVGKVEVGPGRIHRMSFSQDGKTLAVTTDTDCLSFYSCEPMASERNLKYEASSVTLALFHPRRSILAIAVENSIQIAAMDLEALREAMTKPASSSKDGTDPGPIPPWFPDEIQLNGEQVKQLHDALIKAFPKDTSLRFLVKTGLEESLDAIAGGTNLSEIVFNLIEWAIEQGRLKELMEKAYDQNPRNPGLRRFVEPFLGQSAPGS